MQNNYLLKLLVLEGNESNLLSEKGQVLFNKLIVEVVKSINDIRYCTNKNCPCRPEEKIKSLLKDDELNEFLQNEKVLKYVEEISQNQSAITVFDIGVM